MTSSSSEHPCNPFHIHAAPTPATAETWANALSAAIDPAVSGDEDIFDEK
jgi:hypothetical protein